ncbi:MAG: M20 family metallopeptidase [Anaerolineae bacterium]|nr:M20 family metallopeptidase [Anaerolineae bacterium]MDW8172238.1 M20 family metallopeptidase [Anaerolineae bacterium]
MSELLQYFNSQKQAMTDLLLELIGYETFTTEKDMVDKLGNYMEAQFRQLGASSVTRYPAREVGDMLLAKWHEDAPGAPILFLIHIDTVWPSGTLAERPPHIDDEGRLFGPGAVDMKGGITIVLSTLRGLQALGRMPKRPIWVLMTSDEEVGSIHSEALIKETAQRCGLVLVMEPATKEGALKTWRKGIATYTLSIEGRPSHAGNAPEQGINAISEFAQQVIEIHKLNDLKNGVSVNVTMVNGGSAGNVIPAHLEAFIDTRMMTVAQQAKLEAALADRPVFIPGAKVSIKLNHTRPPMERNQAAYEQAQRIGAKYGVSVREDGSGGGSDGNFTAALGIPTLDGLGPQGDGLHALHEHVVLNSLPTRCTLVAGILLDWEF